MLDFTPEYTICTTHSKESDIFEQLSPWQPWIYQIFQRFAWADFLSLFKQFELLLKCMSPIAVEILPPVDLGAEPMSNLVKLVTGW